MAEAEKEASLTSPEVQKEDEEASSDPVPGSQTPPSPVATKSMPQGPQERKGKMFMEEAEKKVKSSQSFLGGLFG